MDHAAALVEQDQELARALAEADWSLPVPTCPEWTVLQLLRHLGRGHRWAAQIVTDRAETALDPRQVRGGKPPEDRAGALDWLTGSSRAVLDAVAAAEPDTTVWTFLGPRPAGWWVRRRLHESTVHRADAAIALGLPYRLPAELAADGIAEFLDLLAAGRGPALAAGTALRLHATDAELGAEGTWTVQGTGAGLRWTRGEDDPAQPQVTVTGPVTDLFLTLLRRAPAENPTVRLTGDQAVWTTWQAQISF